MKEDDARWRRGTLTELQWVRGVVALEAGLGRLEDGRRGPEGPVAARLRGRNEKAGRVSKNILVVLVVVDAQLLAMARVDALLIDVEHRDVEFLEHDGRARLGVDEGEIEMRRAVVSHVDLAEELPDALILFEVVRDEVFAALLHRNDQVDRPAFFGRRHIRVAEDRFVVEIGPNSTEVVRSDLGAFDEQIEVRTVARLPQVVDPRRRLV